MTASSSSGGRAERTRSRIARSAVEVIRQRGFEHVTVQDLARAAEVSPATFYRHFATKEEVVVSYAADFCAALREAVAAVPRDVPRREHLPLVLASFSAFLESQREVLTLQGELVASQPALLRRTLIVQQQIESELATVLAALAGEREPDEWAMLAAGVGMAVLRSVVCSWQAGGQSSFVGAAEQALAQVRQLVGPSPSD